MRVQGVIKPLLPELRAVFLNIRAQSACINNISIVDFLAFFVRMDLVDAVCFPVALAARCFVAVTYFVGVVSRDVADFDHFVEALCCCADARTDNGMVSIEARVRNFLRTVLDKSARRGIN